MGIKPIFRLSSRCSFFNKIKNHNKNTLIITIKVRESKIRFRLIKYNMSALRADVYSKIFDFRNTTSTSCFVSEIEDFVIQKQLVDVVLRKSKIFEYTSTQCALVFYNYPL